MDAIKPDMAEMDFKAIFSQLIGRKWFILFVSILGALVGFLIALIPPNQYQASSVVQIENRSDGVSLPTELIGTLLSGDGAASSTFATEVHVIKTRLILEPVAQELGMLTHIDVKSLPILGDFFERKSILELIPLLDNYIPASYARGDEILTISELVVPQEYEGTPLKLSVLPEGKFALEIGNKRFEGNVGLPLALDGQNSILVSRLEAQHGRVFFITRLPTRSIVAKLARSLSITERPGGGRGRSGSGIIDFSVTNTDPKSVVPVVNTIIKKYQDMTLRRRSAEIDQSIQFIMTQIPNVRLDFESAQLAMSEFSSSQENSRELSLGTQELLIRIVDLETENERMTYEIEEILKRVTPNHPDYIAINDERERVSIRLADAKQDLRSIPQAEQALARLTQNLEGTRALELQLIERVEQLRILRASTVGNVRILEPAEVHRQVGPNRTNPILIGLLAGFSLAALWIFVRNYLHNGIEDGRDLEALGFSLFGTISKVPGIDKGTKSKNYLIARAEPDSPVVEAFRGLRTALGFSLKSGNHKSILITSCAPSDGKSFVSSNLAIIMAHNNYNVLLIDCDMRRGKLKKAFQLPKNAEGLSEVLSSQAEFEDGCHATNVTNLTLMPVGKRPPNPAELLDNQRMGELCVWAETKFDIVILDAPPILAVADALILAPYSGVKLMIIKHMETSPAEASTALNTLKSSGISLTGAILNAYDQKKSKYGSYGYKYGYNYGSYNYNYSKSEDE